MSASLTEQLRRWADDDDRLEERHVPSREPWLSEWCRLHSLHLVALSQVDDETLPKAGLRSALCGAVDLADAKFRLYCEAGAP